MRKFFDVYVDGKRKKRKTLDQLLKLEIKFENMALNILNNNKNYQHVIFANFSYDDRGLKGANFYSNNNNYDDNDYSRFVYNNRNNLIKALHQDKNWKNSYNTF